MAHTPLARNDNENARKPRCHRAAHQFRAGFALVLECGDSRLCCLERSCTGVRTGVHSAHAQASLSVKRDAVVRCLGEEAYGRL